MSAIGGREARFNIGELGFEPLGALLVIAQGGLELVAAGGQIGERAGQLGEGLLRGGKGSICGRDALVDATQTRGVGVFLGPERGLLGGETLECGFRIGCKRALALQVGRILFQSAVELADAFFGAGFLAFQALHAQ